MWCNKVEKIFFKESVTQQVSVKTHSRLTFKPKTLQSESLVSKAAVRIELCKMSAVSGPDIGVALLHMKHTTGHDLCQMSCHILKITCLI